MSTHEEKQIGELTLDEMLADINAAAMPSLPKAGGEYDTVTGWRTRLNLGNDDRIHKLLDRLVSEGLAERDIAGMYKRNSGWCRGNLVRSAWMQREAERVRGVEKKAAER